MFNWRHLRWQKSTRSGSTPRRFRSPIGRHATSAKKLETARAGAREDILTTDLELYASGGDIPPEKQPLDAGFLEMPERILDAYQSDRADSELARILDAAARLRDRVDKVVVLGIGGSYMVREP